MSKSKLKDIDHGWEHIQKIVKKMDNAHVRIGVLSTAGNYPIDENGKTASLPQVAFWNEFGTKTGIPERPFIRATADEKRDNYKVYLQKKIIDVFKGTASFKSTLEKTGMLAQGHVRKKIKTLETPPNAPSTIKKKGSSNPLIDEGFLLRSIDYEVRT
jgi:hypothetical protein